MSTTKKVTYQLDQQGVATLCLNRPERHNAFDDEIIQRLISYLKEIASNSKVRALVLRSEGDNFSAGADLNWMRDMAANSRQQNIDDAMALAELMQRLNELPMPSIALIQGAAFGGALGLAACCDIVIAENNSRFCLSEVKIGLIPAVISPYVIKAIGERQARRYFLTAEVFEGPDAYRLGLVHILVNSPQDFEPSKDQVLKQILNNSPAATAAAKQLILDISHCEIDAELISETARRIADIRVSKEGQEGLSAFLEKRKPNWISSHDG